MASASPLKSGALSAQRLRAVLDAQFAQGQ